MSKDNNIITLLLQKIGYEYWFGHEFEGSDYWFYFLQNICTTRELKKIKIIACQYGARTHDLLLIRQTL